MEGWCVGVTVAWSHHSCTMGGRTNTHGDTITHTNERNTYVRLHSALFRRNVAICFFLFFCKMDTNSDRALSCPRLSCFLCIRAPSQARLILIFMSWARRAYYYYHYCYYAFWGREITLGLAEAVQRQGLSLLQSSDWSDLWFMRTTFCLR